ncbi:MAG: Asp23/Gls24 family envelope stress response protein [Firmicutes bacterium]|jgi:uncharacterized alkaline shock family protein YloU|nr:Asp23/Gls24 family envelope stress response protein [Bacillota bacterium]
MLKRIQNERGAVSIDENIISDMIARGIRNYSGNVWIANYKGIQTDDWMIALGNIGALAEKKISLEEDGSVFVRVYLVMRIGLSIKDVAGSIIESVRRGVEEQLCMELSDVEVIITGMMSPKGRVVKRHITVSLRNGLTEEDADEQ